ncbi:MAG: VVA0879 family protein [Methylococcaceae bacterium]|jgi:hypothetical protein
MKKEHFQRRKTTIHAYYDEAIALFGENTQNWKFVCPVCGHITSVADYQDAGAPEGAIAFSCVGRWTSATQTIFDDSSDKTGPCDYSGGGLFDFNPVEIEDFGNYFEFAKPEATTLVLSHSTSLTGTGVKT